VQKLVAQVLAAWREAERVVAEHEPGTPDYEAAMVAELRLRDLYAELTAVLSASVEDEGLYLDSIAQPSALSDPVT
jgi:hypothetical protein